MDTTSHLVVEEATEPAPTDDRLLVKWLECQSETLQKKLAVQKLEELLGKAAQPRHASGNACIKLCYFIEQCRKSKAPQVRDASCSQKTCLDLFNFYIEWNEKNQNRSMRQVLELLASLISQHPQKDTASSVKESILERIVAIITHRAAQPLVKPAFKLLECFLSKGVISPQELVNVHEHRQITRSPDTSLRIDTPAAWDSVIAGMFEWLALPDVSPAAGKCLVTLFGQLKVPEQLSEETTVDHALLWQRWIRSGLAMNPESLENVKNYLFPPLFKVDRSASLAFLEDLNKQKPMSDFRDKELNAHSLLQLAAIEVGKKAGLVEEPSTHPVSLRLVPPLIYIGTIKLDSGPKRKVNSVVFQEDLISPLLVHASDTVRSLAFSVLVSSSSSIRLFNGEAFQILKSNLGVLHADTDSKFRNEVLSTSKHMVERIRGATAFLVRELQSLLFAEKRDAAIRERNNQNRIQQASEALRNHQDFTQWYLEFLMGELIPTASYQRHITALKAIGLLLRSGILQAHETALPANVADNDTRWPFTIQFFTSGVMRLLLDLVMDPFEDVRINAAETLNLAPCQVFADSKSAEYVESVGTPAMLETTFQLSELPQKSRLCNGEIEITRDQETLGLLKGLLARAENVSKRTGRADYADGLARTYALLYRLSPSKSDRLGIVGELVRDLETKSSIARTDLSRAVSSAPVHGTFAALNLVWESIDGSFESQFDNQLDEDNRKMISETQTRILSNCSLIWQAVKNVLCNDSPEGHLPDDLDEMPSIDTKDVLSYSFRAIHESSNLMRTMISKIKSNRQDGSSILPRDVFIGIGQLTFEQLSTLRHRGAFSTVSLTFARCCQLAQYQERSDAPDSDILTRWYKGAIACIFEQASTTRRSAGIPALVTGVLSANSKSPSFDLVIAELISFAEQPVQLSKKDQTNLPQVHAMNCLKEILKSSILGKKAESHIADCLQLAANSLNAEIWAIRNCGLLLLRSLIDCLFGTSEGKSVTEAGWDGRSIRLSYDRYPTLPNLLLKLLDTDTSHSSELTVPVIGSVESVFPALDIIRRAGPPSTHRDEIYRCVSMHLGSRIWHVREISARTICTLMLHDNWLRDVLELLAGCGRSANRLHGVLLAVRLILQRRLTLDPKSVLGGVVEIGTFLGTSAMQSQLHCERGVILAAYFEVCSTFAKCILVASKHASNLPSEAVIQTIVSRFIGAKALQEYFLLTKTQAYEMDGALGIAIARRAVYASAVLGDLRSLQKILRHATELNIDMALAAVDCVPQAWSNCSSVVMLDIATAYLGLISATRSSEVCSAAMLQLAETFDKRFEQTRSAEKPIGFGYITDADIRVFGFDISALQREVQGRKETPSLVNARLKISGVIPLFKEFSYHLLPSSAEPDRAYLQSWGLVLSAAGEANNDFETRHAASAALAMFYGNSQINGYICSDEHTVASLFALYDTLDDDDDEIRDMGARTVSSLLGKSLVPLAAQVEFADWICKYHQHRPGFAWSVVRRMSGSTSYDAISKCAADLLSAEDQLLQAMKEDDSLFIEEEQNLFTDEIREGKVWCQIFEKVSKDYLEEEQMAKAWDKPQKILGAWVLQGLKTLISLLQREDGPLGWASKPSVFAICMRIILSARSTLRCRGGMSVEYSGTGSNARGDDSVKLLLEQFVSLGKEKRIHERLLFEVEGRF